jgi:hypothetical protein
MSVPQQPIQPVRLVRDDAQPPAVTTAPALDWLPIVGVVAAFVALAAIARWVYWLRRTDLGARTFQSLARRRRLSAADRDLLHSLAALSAARPAHPVALLLSPDAYTRAAELAVKLRAPWASPPAIVDLHARLFGP